MLLLLLDWCWYVPTLRLENIVDMIRILLWRLLLRVGLFLRLPGMGFYLEVGGFRGSRQMDNRGMLLKLSGLWDLLCYVRFFPLQWPLHLSSPQPVSPLSPPTPSSHVLPPPLPSLLTNVHSRPLFHHPGETQSRKMEPREGVSSHELRCIRVELFRCGGFILATLLPG